MPSAARLEVLWQRLLLVLEEAAWTIVRTSISTAVHEAWDFSCLLFDARGRMIAQNTTISGKIGVWNTILQALWPQYPPDSLRPGDIFLTNDPWLADGHLYDVDAVMPLFHKGALVGYMVCVAHMSDIGGSTRNDAHDVYEEGLFIPIVRVVKEGQEDQELMRLIQGNVRLPGQLTADLRALFSALIVGGHRISEFLATNGLENLDELSNEIIGRTEAAMREGILNRVPKGRWEGSIEADGLDERITLRVSIEPQGDNLIVDFTGSSPQQPVGVNLVYNYALAWTVSAVKAVISPSLPNNEGCYIPIRLVAPEGSIVNPIKGAPVRMRGSTGHLVPLVILSAFASAGVDRFIGDSGLHWIQRFLGTNHAGHKVAELVIFTGGTGARAKQDGVSCLSFPGNTQNSPVEVLEEALPILVHERALVPDSGGSGRWRGGLGQRMSYSVLPPHPLRVMFQLERIYTSPAGLFGGHPGSRGRALIDGSPIPSKSQFNLLPGSEVVLEVSGGGGAYPPEERDRERVEADLRNGLITEQAAYEEYLLDDDRPEKAKVI